MLISVNAFDDVLTLKVLLYKFINDHCVDWDLGETNEDSTDDSVHLRALVPGVASDVLDTVSNLWICLQNISDEVFCVFARDLRDCVLSIQNFLVEVGSVRVLKGQITTDKCE